MIVVGVDGGSTKTVALVADAQGTVLGSARGGGSNWSGENVEVPMRVVAETVREAVRDAERNAQANARISPEDVALGMFTLAGADWPEDHTNRRAALEAAGIALKIVVKNDSFGGLRAGTSKPYGMVLAAGSGMNAAVIAPDGQEWAFGYYETFGGARTLAQDAFYAVLRAEDGRGLPTCLTQSVTQRLGFETVEAMLRAWIAGTVDRRRFLAITPLVFEAALAGDAVASEILVHQGRGLAEYATAMARRFNMQQMEFDVVLAGSVFKGVGPLLVDTLTQEIHREAPFAKIIRARFEPVVGSVLLAYDALGIPVTDAMMEQLARTVPTDSFFNTAA